MQRNVLIGLGATGARTVTSAIHLCAAGLGPDNLSVGFVEQNPTQPDVARAQDALACFVHMQASICSSSPPAPHHIGSDSPLARVNMEPLGAIPTNLWRPAGPAGALAAEARRWTDGEADAGMVTRALFGLQPAETSLVDQTDFGAQFDLAAFAIAANGGNIREAFWDSLAKKIYSASTVAPLRIVLVGAPYEPIGAGALEFARQVGALVETARKHDVVDIACALLTPHHVVPAAGGKSKAFPTGALEHTRSTLACWGRALEEEPVIQQLYVMGWSPGFRVSADAQPPLGACPADLIAALGALQHFERPATGMFVDETRVEISTREREHLVCWADLNGAWRDGHGQPDIARAVAAFVIFAYNWRAHYSAQLQTQSQKLVLRQQWFKSCCPNIRNVSSGESANFFRSIDEYTLRALSWAHEMGDAQHDSASYRFSLWRSDTIARALGRPEAANGAAPTSAHAPENLIADGANSTNGARPARAVEAALGGAAISDDAAGLGRLVEALYSVGVLGSAAPTPQPAASERLS